MKRTAFIVAVAMAATAVTGISAQARGQGPDFATLDSDGNGELTREELQARGAVMFEEADADGNGLLSAEELAAHASQRAADRATRMIERMDANGDGQLSPEELTERRNAGRIFDRMDADDSGTITQAEFDAARERFRERRGGRNGTD
ncbi:MAG: EF-hand domain-containing protein [Pseudomonadota bacterium]